MIFRSRRVSEPVPDLTPTQRSRPGDDMADLGMQPPSPPVAVVYKVAEDVTPAVNSMRSRDPDPAPIIGDIFGVSITFQVTGWHYLETDQGVIQIVSLGVVYG